MRNPGGGILDKESLRKESEAGILNEESWKRNPRGDAGGGILEEESRRRNPGRGILEEEY